jgi:hypothetical protein
VSSASHYGTDSAHPLQAIIITGGCGSIGGGAAKAIIAKGGIAVVSPTLSKCM